MATDLHTPPQIDDTGVDLAPEALRTMYAQMVLARRLDERAWIMHRQGKIAFHISGIGHEGVQIGAAQALRAGYDYVHPYYRDLALNLALGYTAREFMLALLGKAGETTSGARQMPSHFGNRALNILSCSSPVATQVPQAAGVALACKLRHEDRVTLVTLGEGSTSQGEFYEGMNWAGVHRLPLICLVQNNIYAISVPIEMQMAVPNVADRGAAFGVRGVIVDGNDALASYRVLREAVARARAGEGATLVEAKTYRPVPHSSDDDDRSYRSREEVEEWKRRDPIARFEAYLLARDLLTAEEVEQINAQALESVTEAQQAAEAAPFPDPATLSANVFAPPEHE